MHRRALLGLATLTGLGGVGALWWWHGEPIDPNVATVTASDLDAVRALRVVWATDEAGVPAVYGTLGLQLDELAYRRAVVAAEVLMHQGRLAPGRYEYTRHPSADDSDPFTKHGYAVLEGSRVTFDLTERHLKLIQHARTRLFDDGGRDFGVSIDPKRPYGDMTYFELDMGAILGLAASGSQRRDPPHTRDFTDEQLELLGKLHEQIQPALQIFLQRAELDSDEFVRDPPDYGRWRRR